MKKKYINYKDKFYKIYRNKIEKKKKKKNRNYKIDIY